MDGLKIKNGRLVNDRPVGTTGIQEAARARALRKEAKLVKQIADGVDLAELRKGFLL